MNTPFNWVCPYCNNPQSVTKTSYSEGYVHIGTNESKHGNVGMSTWGISCANPECMELSLGVIVSQDSFEYGSWKFRSFGSNIFKSRLLPGSSAKPQPEFIPAALREDYSEACLIRELSPKASATLSRRCLQGMIRDFCGISRKTLFQEIDALRGEVEAGRSPIGVSPDSVEAIDAVRTVGNIGAHMEADIDHIIPVDPDEAQLLIDLIETLFEEWYVARETRSRKFAAVKDLAAQKRALIEAGKPAVALPPPE